MFFETGLPWIDQAVFTPQVGDPVSLNVIIEREENFSLDDFETRISGVQYRLESLYADLGQVPVARTPNRPGDFFTVDGVKYEVTQIEERENKFIVCAVRPVE